METRLYFENLPEFNLQPQDKVYVINEKVGPIGIVYISRADESKYVSGVYNCTSGKLVLANDQYDDIGVVPIPIHGVSGNESFYEIVKDGKVGAISLTGILIAKPENKEVKFSYGTFIIKTMNGKYGAVSEEGKNILPAKYKKMKIAERVFVVAYGDKDEVSVICYGRILAKDVMCQKVSVYSHNVILHKENSFELYSRTGKIGEFEGTARYRSERFGPNNYVGITNGNLKSLVSAKDGTVIVPPGEYTVIKKVGNEFIAEKATCLESFSAIK